VDYISGKGKYADRSLHPLPCIMLLDIRLPLLTGFEVVKWLRPYEPCSALPVVFLTSSNAEMDIHQAYDLGGNAYLVKPPTTESVTQMVKDLRDSG